MSFKRTKVVMLPTNEKANLSVWSTKEFPLDELMFSRDRHNFDENELLYVNLYFLSDEEIKEGDWVIHGFINDYIYQINKHNIKASIPNKSKKIIATTDKNLMWLDKSEKNPELARPNGLWKCLPQPSEGFIQKFVDSYNSGKPITEVDVEYEKIKQALSVIPKKTKIGTDYTEVEWEFQETLKVNPKDNTITIKKVKDSWIKTDEDLIKAFEDFACAVYDANYTKDMSIRQRAKIMSKQWIEENL